MPFATTIDKTVNLGGGARIYIGTWSGNVGDPTGTMTIQGGRVYIKWFRTNGTSDYADVIPVSDAAGSTDGTRTLSVYNNADVASGTFFIVAV